MMALVKCHECGGPVSTTAKTCPQCGAKPHYLFGWHVGEINKLPNPDLGIGGFLIALAVLGLVLWGVWYLVL